MTDDERETACAPAAMPASMAPLLTDHQWSRDRVGESGSAVYRLHGNPDAPDLFLKHGKDRFAKDVTDEMVRLPWLAASLPVPEVVHFVRTPDQAWLLTTALPGRTAYQMLRANPAYADRIVDALADFLRRLHVISIDACPFNSDHRLRLRDAEGRIAAGLVETDEFDRERQGWTTDRLWQALQDHLPFTPDPVVTHGDFSLDNLLMQDDRVIGCIDVGRVGIADRYQDLAILWNCLGEFAPALQHRALRRYGIPHPDRRKLDFHLMLDECF